MYRDVEREPLPFFLREVNLQKLSGHLFITAKDFQITLNFLDGKLANGMSTRFDEKLPVILHLMGRIDEEQYNFISGMHQFSDDQVAGILLDQNLAKKKDIYYARIYQLRRIAISAFSLQQGKWIFTAGEPDPPLREVFEIPLESILVEGARSIDHISPYAGRWQYDIPVLFNEIPMASEIYFTDAEREFYAAVRQQGRLSCQELISRLNILPLDFWRMVLAFHLLGIVDFEKGRAALDLSGDIAALLELNQRLQGSPGAAPEMLGLSAAASVAAVEKAKEELLTRFAPERFGSAAAPEIKKIARAVCGRLREVAASPPMPPVAPEPPPEPAELPVIETEWVIELEPPVFPEVSYEPREQKGEPPVVAEQPEPAFELSAEFAIDAEPAAEAEAIVDALEPDEAAIEPAPETEPARPFVPAAPPSSLRMADPDHEMAWELMVKSKELYDKRDFMSAVSLLKKAIRLHPGQGDFHYLLGLCQSKVEVYENEAEINLKKAIELKSWSADPVYALGALYRGQGKMKLAERCFQRVKEISYEHTGASRALVDLRRLRAPKKRK